MLLVPPRKQYADHLCKAFVHDMCLTTCGGQGYSAVVYGALFGLVVYGVYDFTNYSTLRQWPFVLALVDVAWGAVASAACAVAVRMMAR